jgi:hypothetical protein
MIHQYEWKEIKFEGKKGRKRTGTTKGREKRNYGKTVWKQTERKNNKNEER